MANSGNYDVDKVSARRDRILNSGALGVGVVTVVQLLPLDHLGLPLWVSLVCFAVSLPMSSMNVFVLSIEIARDEMPRKPRGVRASVYVGPIAAFVGVTAIFWHFQHLLAILFVVISGVVLYLGMRYVP